ncbi:MAG: DUF1517 domain-containing protein [Elainella sp.]
MAQRKHKPQFFGLLILLVVAVSAACLYLLARPSLYGQSLLFHPELAQINESAITGGRAKGGSFSQPAPSSEGYEGGSGGRSGYGGGYSGSRGYGGGYGGSGYFDYGSPRQLPGYSPAPVLIPYPSAPVYIPGPTAAPASGGLDIGFIFLLLVLGFAVLPIILNYIKLGSKGMGNELTNNIVTVTALQVALLAEARELQRDLTRLTEQTDLSTSEGLNELLRETVLALLRFPSFWTHARVRSQTVSSREAASRLFEQLSLQERSKFSQETLANVGGQIRRQSRPLDANADPAAFIVVTLLLGTADDKPLLNPVRSSVELSQALQRVGSISSDYLLVYELLWSPQDETDSLSREELIAQYPDLVQL